MKIGVVQLTSVLDPKVNLEKIDHFLSEASQENCEAVFLPECFYSLGSGNESTPYLVKQGNEHYEAINSLAVNHSITILGGSAATVNPTAGKALNRCYNFDANGKAMSTYDKIHLFSCDMEMQNLDEAQVYQAGNQPQTLTYKQMKLGLGICFDLRFPEMARKYAIEEQVNALSFSSAFTYATGKDHWHTLLRARAIENQCYVIAAAQWGKNNEKIHTYGHSLIVDPWGEIIVDAGEGETIVYGELDFTYLNEVRSRLKVLQY